MKCDASDHHGHLQTTQSSLSNRPGLGIYLSISLCGTCLPCLSCLFLIGRKTTSHVCLTSLSRENLQHLQRLLVRREQDAAGHDGPAQPHHRAPPEPADAVLGQDGPHGLHGADHPGLLRLRLDRVEGLRHQGRDGAGHGAVREAHGRPVRVDAARPLHVLDGAVRPEPEPGRADLLQGTV